VPLLVVALALVRRSSRESFSTRPSSTGGRRSAALAAAYAVYGTLRDLDRTRSLSRRVQVALTPRRKSVCTPAGCRFQPT